MTQKEKIKLRKRLTTKCEAFFFKQEWLSEKITKSLDIFNWIQMNIDITDIDWKESFHCLYLNRANKILAFDTISKGGISSTIADVKVIIFQAIMCQSSAIVLVHNHPSGNLEASTIDKKLTNDIISATKYFNLTLLDHLILADNKFLSFADEGLI